MIVRSASAPLPPPAARRAFETIRVAGSGDAYARKVITALDTLQDGYNDTDGDYTGGKAVIGDVCLDVGALLREIAQKD